MGVMRFETTNLTVRDWTIASLLDVGLQGRAIAALCHTSPAQVSMVRKLVRQGGHDALVHRRPGRSRKLTGRRLLRAMKLRQEGKTHDQIGEALGVSSATARRAVYGVARGGERQQVLGGVGASPTPAPSSPVVEQPSSEEGSDGESRSPATEAAEMPPGVGEPESSAPCTESADGVADQLESSGSQGEKKPTELIPAMPLPAGPAEHPSRYAGTLMICSAVQMLGLNRALTVATVQRPQTAWYDAQQAVMALMSAWGAGFGSLEAMHERDARSLGVVLGLERSPCVRTHHRAIAQMGAVFDPIALGAALLQGLMGAVGQAPRVFGIDGHFKAYSGPEPVDKGWDTKQEAVFRPPTYAHEGAERAGGRNAVLDMPALARGHEPSTMGFSGGAAARTRRHG
jgi:hypothetical protein